MVLTVLSGVAGAASSTAVLALVHRNSVHPRRFHRLDSLTARFTLAAILGTAAAVLAARHGAAGLAAGATPLVLGTAAAVVDLRELRLPNRLTMPLLLAALITGAVHTLIADNHLGAATHTLGAAAAATAMMALSRLLRSSAIGWGDIKLAPSLGCYLGVAGGWDTTYLGLVLWWILIAAGAAIALATGALRRDDPMPYGPAMLAGTLIAVLAA